MNQDSANGMLFDATELLNLAIISKRPVLVVEGIDDVPIYERLASSVGADCDVYASESLCKTREGCEGVIANIKDIREVADNIPVERYVLGIIDRDVRFYRGEMAVDPAIFTLEYYSIESHYVNNCSTAYLIPLATRATSKLIDESLIDSVHRSIVPELEFLYYVSLEALRNACESEYKSAFGYKKSIKSITNAGLHTEALKKKDELDQFANRLSLQNSMDTLLKICKGKWIFEIYGDRLYDAIKKLPGQCRESKITQCQFCANGNFDTKKCLYHTPAFTSSDILRSQAWHNTEVKSLEYIKAKLSEFTAKANS
ncbi:MULTISPECIES: DUF4435 domain-containing protein [unclassified Pseudomonas]|uniref:DUF4435 domain-containing protein n=1 Tax=Pseudomonas TaxID=286 RepID=UPI000A1EA3D9|nr:MULTISPECIES: DUF4435 domain-containing protein [unclassified Pseudomonas]